MAAREEGIQALRGGNPAAAVSLLGQAVAANPQDAQALAYLGAAYGQLGQFGPAVDSLQKAVALAPQSAGVRFNLGTALEKAGRLQEAAAAYRQVLALDPGYARAAEALQRLGAAPAAPPPAPAAAAPPPAPAPPAAGLGEFALGGEPAAAPPAQPVPPPPAGSGAYGAVPNIYAQPPAYGAPPGPSPLDPPPPPPPPPQAWAPGGPPGGMQPLGDWTPPPGEGPPAHSGPPGGMQPMGDWTPPPGEAAPPWGPPPQPVVNQLATGATGAVVARAENPEKQMPKSYQQGHCFLAGMGTGVWWGLIGMLFVLIMPSLSLPGSQYGRIFPTLFVMGLMYVALGALIYGLIGMAGASASDAESLCGNLGATVGLLQGAAWFFFFPGVWLGLFQIFGCIWVSRQLAKSLGASINEMFASVFVVAGPGGVAMTPMGR